MLIPALLLLTGFALLIIGGNFLVNGAVSLAMRLGVTPLIIGLTIVTVGTTTPEMLVSINAALEGVPAIAVGNVVGSNICNILLVLGISVLVRPITIQRGAIRRDGVFMILAVVMFIAIALSFGAFGRAAGGAMLALLVAILFYTYQKEKNRKHHGVIVPAEEDIEGNALVKAPHWKSWLWLGLGIAALVVGAQLLVDGAVTIARAFAISEAVIGLSMVAIGTSLPELFASITAAVKKQDGVRLGNVVGGNIYNILAILGVTALITPVAIPTQVVAADMWVMLAATLALVPTYYARRIGRLYGAAMLLAYAGYMAWLFNNTTFN